MNPSDPSDTNPIWSPDQLTAVSSRLRGELVATPLIGGITLPPDRPDVDLRVKAESLQPTGSPFIRGAMHWCGRQMGARRGVVVDAYREPPGGVAALVRAARIHRIPLEVSGAEAAVLDAADPAVSLDAAHVGWAPTSQEDSAHGVERRAVEGWTVWPGWDHGDAALGLASLGWELGLQLPADTAVAVVSHEVLRRPLREGLRMARLQGPAGGEPVQVAVAGAAPDSPEDAADLHFLRAATGLALAGSWCHAVLQAAWKQVSPGADRTTAVCVVL